MSLKDWIEHEIPTSDNLFCTHTTKWKSFEEILKNDQIENISDSTIDPISGKVVYLFYGIPSYRYFPTHKKNVGWSLTGLHDRPIGIILHSRLVKEASHLVPFDTGAFLNEFFQDHIGSTVSDLKFFHVEIVDGTEPNKVVARYYGNTNNYLTGFAKKGVSPFDSTEYSLLEFFLSTGPQNYDNRSNVIELQVPNTIDLRGNTECLILPKNNFTKNKHIFPDIESKYKVLFYNDTYRYSTTEDCRAIQEVVLQYYQSIGILN